MKGRTSTRKRPAFGARLAAARIGQALTQAQLARKLGVDRSTVRHYERSVTDPKLSVVLGCCAALDLPLSSLLDGASAPTSPKAQLLQRFNQSLLRLSPRKQQFALRLFSRQLAEIGKETP